MRPRQDEYQVNVIGLRLGRDETAINKQTTQELGRPGFCNQQFELLKQAGPPVAALERAEPAPHLGNCAVMNTDWKQPILVKSRDRHGRQAFFTNIFPGNCLINRFISRLSSATDTAELGRPLLRITSSMLISSWSNVS